MTTPADELHTAADKLRPSSPAIAAHTAWVKIRPEAAEPIAKLLREIAALHEPTLCQKHEGCEPFGCDWCGDEDWPCNDVRNALAVARAINGSQPLCGTPHHDYPESTCTEPAGHYQRITDPHAGPLIIDSHECGVAAWDEPEEQR